MKDYGIKLGTLLFTMVQPRAGHEVEYNRWYERDHYYAGVMIAPFTLAGSRWVATRAEKALRYPTEANVMTPEPSIGSYLGLYYVEKGHHDEWNRWSVDQVNWLHANGRMFNERDHIHTALYDYQFCAQRDENGVSPELALDHRFPCLVTLSGEIADGVSQEDAGAWLAREWFPTFVNADSPVALALVCTPMPLLDDAPGDVGRVDSGADRFIVLCFADEPCEAVWQERFAGIGEQWAAGGKVSLAWAGPFRPTIVGTDTYTDQL